MARKSWKEQNIVLDKILAAKVEEEAAPEIVEVLKLLGTVTESLVKLIINVTNTSQEKLLKCEEEVATDCDPA